MSHLLEQASTWLVDNDLSAYLFALLLLLAFAEAGLFVGFVLPGETALLVGGAFTATGVLPYVPFVLAAVVAAAAGDSFGYFVGHRYGDRVRGSAMGRRVGHARWDAGGAFLVRNGGRSVFLGRGQALLRALVPFLAGQSRMAYRVFLPWNVLGALVWGGGVVVLGHVFAEKISTIETVLGRVGIAVLVVLAVVLVVRHRRSRRRELGLDTEEPEDAGPPLAPEQA